MHTRRSSFAAAVLVGSILVAATAQGAVLSYKANLNAAQEGGSVNSNGHGTGTFTIDTDLNTVAYNIRFSHLTSAETVAHIHGFAAPGASAPPVHTLPLGSPKVGVWNYVEGQEASILAGLAYVNIHSSNYTGGEIRGQIVAAATPGAGPWGIGLLSALVLGTGAVALSRRRRLTA